MRRVLLCAGMVAAACGPNASVSAGVVTSYGPTHYESVADTPAGFCTGVCTVEDFETGVNGFLTLSPGQRIGPSFTSGNPLVTVDSVDLDGAGADDDSGSDGWSWYGGNADFISVTFQDPVSAAGLVFTDGDAVSSDVVLKAYDAANALIATLSAGDLADGDYGGQTAEDRFLGFTAPMGIQRLEISLNAGTGIEIDHVQWQAIPEPTAGVLLLSALIGLVGYRRR